MPHVLLTNDDGFDREGIGALREALLAADLDVTVLAPSGDRSGASRSITCHGLVDVVEHAGGEAPILHCSGTPVDAVRIGLLSERCAPADVVVSGINHGTNLGDDVHYSGTVAAAVEAALLGVPGIAFSQQADDGGVGLRETGAHGFALAGLAASLVRHVVERPPPPGVALSVNLPARPPAPGAVALVRPGRRAYRRGWLAPAETEPGVARFQPYAGTGSPPPPETEPDTDFAALLAGRVTVTVLHAAPWVVPSGARAWADGLALAALVP